MAPKPPFASEKLVKNSTVANAIKNLSNTSTLHSRAPNEVDEVAFTLGPKPSKKDTRAARKAMGRVPKIVEADSEAVPKTKTGKPWKKKAVKEGARNEAVILNIELDAPIVDIPPDVASGGSADSSGEIIRSKQDGTTDPCTAKIEDDHVTIAATALLSLKHGVVNYGNPGLLPAGIRGSTVHKTVPEKEVGYNASVSKERSTAATEGNEVSRKSDDSTTHMVPSETSTGHILIEDVIQVPKSDHAGKSIHWNEKTSAIINDSSLSSREPLQQWSAVLPQPFPDSGPPHHPNTRSSSADFPSRIYSSHRDDSFARCEARHDNAYPSGRAFEVNINGDFDRSLERPRSASFPIPPSSKGRLHDSSMCDLDPANARDRDQIALQPRITTKPPMMNSTYPGGPFMYVEDLELLADFAFKSPNVVRRGWFESNGRLAQSMQRRDRDLQVIEVDGAPGHCDCDETAIDTYLYQPQARLQSADAAGVSTSVGYLVELSNVLKDNAAGPNDLPAISLPSCSTLYPSTSIVELTKAERAENATTKKESSRAVPSAMLPASPPATSSRSSPAISVEDLFAAKRSEDKKLKEKQHASSGSAPTQPAQKAQTPKPTVPTIIQGSSASLSPEAVMQSARNTRSPAQRSITGQSLHPDGRLCTFCGKLNHTEDRCFKKHPEKLDEFLARRHIPYGFRRKVSSRFAGSSGHLSRGGI